MLIKPKRTAKADFLEVYAHAIENYTTNSKQDPRRLYNLRCSQLPYCPASVLLNWGSKGMVQSMDMLMAFYVTVGTAVHEVMQTYLAQSGRFLADYKCEECGVWHRLSHVVECCGFHTTYHEVDLDYKGVQGHIDGIFQDLSGNYYILDFKTTSLEGAKGKPSNPGLGYKLQIFAYAYLLWKQYGIKVSGAMLVFIPRDNPKVPTIVEFKMTAKAYEDAAQMLKRNRALHRKTMVASTLTEMKPLLNIKCGNVYCKTCKLNLKTKLSTVKKHLSKYPIRKAND